MTASGATPASMAGRRAAHQPAPDRVVAAGEQDPNAFPKYIGFFNTDHKVPVYSSDFSGYYIVNVQRVTPPPKPPQVDAAS